MPTDPVPDAAAHAQARLAMLDRVTTAKLRRSTLEEAQAGWHAIPRAYQRSPDLPQEQRLSLLVERLGDYDAQVNRVSQSGLPAAVEQAIALREARQGRLRMLVPAGLPPADLPHGREFTVDHGFAPADLDSFDGILTRATLAIAITGTLVLQSVPGQGRRAATLVPDFHLCILDESDVVETVPEALTRLRSTAALPTTFISGPSATADIEMTRIKGVHGPRFLHVLLVGRALEV